MATLVGLVGGSPAAPRRLSSHAPLRRGDAAERHLLTVGLIITVPFSTPRTRRPLAHLPNSLNTRWALRGLPAPLPARRPAARPPRAAPPAAVAPRAVPSITAHRTPAAPRAVTVTHVRNPRTLSATQTTTTATTTNIRIIGRTVAAERAPPSSAVSRHRVAIASVWAVGTVIVGALRG